MLRPVVRGSGRSAVLQCRRCPVRRQLHVTPIRSVEDSDKPGTGDDSAQKEKKQEESLNRTAPTENYSFVSRVRDEIDAEHNFLKRSQERETKVAENKREYNIPSDTTLDPSERTYKDFRTRRKERLADIDETREKFNIVKESIHERSRLFLKEIHDARAKSNEEANIRGEEVFKQVLEARSRLAKVDAEGNLIDEPSPARERSRYNDRDRPSRYDDRESSSRYDDKERSSRYGDRERPRRDGDNRTDIQKRTDGPIAKNKPRVHTFAPDFDPSKPLVQGMDEIDFEFGYEMPDPPRIRENFTVTNRDGTSKAGRKTNRDFDELPEDAGSFIDMSSFGPVGHTFYSTKPEGYEEEDFESIKERIMEMDFPENTETDVQELWKIKKEIEEGRTTEERIKARREREIVKEAQRVEAERMEGVNSRTWSQLVPLPMKHRPETVDVDNYVAPVLDHGFFRYGIPSVPFGSTGRLNATYSVTQELSDSLLPQNLDDLQEQSPQDPDKVDKTADEILDWITGDHPNYPTTQLRPFDRHNRRVSGPPPQTTERPGPIFDPDREVSIEDLYDDNQTAIWRELNKNSYAPKHVTFPSYDSEEEEITPEQQELESKQRVEAADVMDILDAAMTKRFRVRDEFEIRDIRRRLGLPIVTENVMMEAHYEKPSLDEPSSHDPIHPEVLKAEIEKQPAPIVEDEVIKLEFWRESKKTLETLFARIKQLRQITQETSERIRRHGTAEMVERHVSETSAIPAHTNDIITTLKTQFTNVHKKLENLEILITAARFGPGGPQDQEYSDAWVEHHFHEYEKTEFERTAVAMGFPPNSVSMEPVVPDDVHESLAAMTDTFWDEMTRVGVAGEYKGKGLTPGEGMPFPLNLAGRYAGENSGLDQYQKGQRIWMLAQTVEKLDIPMEDPLVKKPVEEDEDVDDEEMEEAETEDATAEPERPFVVTPGPRFSPDFTSIVSKLRQSMSEVDQDMTSLEKNYDAFLKRQSPPVTSEQNSTLEAST